MLPTIESATYDGCERRLSSGCTQREDASYWDLLPPELRFEILRTAAAATSSSGLQDLHQPLPELSHVLSPPFVHVPT